MFLLYDIGGTKMRLAISHDLETFDGIKIVPTPDDFEEAMQVFAQAVWELSQSEKIEAGAGGIAGAWNKDKSKLLNSPNMKGWMGKPVKERVEQIIKAPAYFENDASIVGLGEAVFGAGKDYSVVVYITVSTGVGGARIVDKKIDRSIFGFEPGHQIVKIPESVREEPVTLEELVSGTAVKRRFGKEPFNIKDEKVWDELARELAYGLNNSIVHWSPEAVVLGGSMIVGNPAIDIEKIRKHLEETVTIFKNLPKIKKAALEDKGGLYGAMAYLKNL